MFKTVSSLLARTLPRRAQMGQKESRAQIGQVSSNGKTIRASVRKATIQSPSVSPSKPLVFNNPFVDTSLVSHEFKFGVGNKFRSLSQNRFHPTRLLRPKTVWVRPNYFKSDTPSVLFDRVNEAWEVYFSENGKVSAKPFPVRKFGVEASKLKAIEFNTQVNSKSEGALHSPNSSSVPPPANVIWDERMQSAFSMTGTKQVTHFPASKFKGRLNAQTAAAQSANLNAGVQSVNGLLDKLRSVVTARSPAKKSLSSKS